VFEVPAVVLAQFMVACAFAVRTMRVSFDQIPVRFEQVALTLGCNRSQAFWLVVFPQSRRGLLAAGTLAWARSLGEFGPILVFAGSTRMRTEVLPTSVYLEMQSGDLKGMLSVSILMIALSAAVLILARALGMQRINA
jgi:molybdate transport system permease protein